MRSLTVQRTTRVKCERFPPPCLHPPQPTKVGGGQQALLNLCQALTSPVREATWSRDPRSAKTTAAL